MGKTIKRKFTTNLDEEIIAKLKIQAVIEKTSVNAIIERLAIEYLANIKTK